MYAEFHKPNLCTLILGDDDGLRNDKQCTIKGEKVGRLYVWSNKDIFAGGVQIPGRIDVVPAYDQNVPPIIKALYNIAEIMETSPFFISIATLNGVAGLLASTSFNDDYLKAGIFETPGSKLSQTELDVTQEAVFRLAVAMREDKALDLPTKSTIIAASHSLGVFFPKDLCIPRPHTTSGRTFKSLTKGAFADQYVRYIHETLFPKIAHEVLQQVTTHEKIYRCSACGGTSFTTTTLGTIRSLTVDENDKWRCAACGMEMIGTEFLSDPLIVDTLQLRKKPVTSHKRVCVTLSGYAVVPGRTDEEIMENIMHMARKDFDWEPFNSDVLRSAEIIEDCGPND